MIHLQCDEFCTKSKSDVLRVYDGKSADDNLIDSYSGCESIDVYFNTREIFISWSTDFYTTRYTSNRTGFNCTLSIEGMDMSARMLVCLNNYSII